MPQLGLGTEIGRVSGGAYDSDALAYFARAGIASGTQTPTAYDNAASFNGTNQFLSRASNSTLTVTGSSFTFAFWANTPNTSSGMVISKTAGTDTREFQIGLRTSGVAEFRLFPDGIFANGRLVETSASSFSANTWNFFAYRYDSSAATIGISVNGGAFTTLGSIPAITQTNTNPLNLGVFVNTASGVNYTGQLASVGFWKKALSASEVTQLWNAGAGRTYASLDTGLRNNLISWWALNQNSVTADSHGTNTLTNNGTPLVTATTLGPIITGYSDSRRLISDFVRGIKGLGLWNSMVCWPLRSSQNAGGGTTAFSLGGLGQFNGTLVNAPTWGSDGINCATTSQRLTFGPAVNIQSYGGFTIFGTQIHRNLSSSSDLSLLTRNDGLWPESTYQAVSQVTTLIRIGTSPSRHVTATRSGTEQNLFHSYHATVDSNESGFLTYNKTSPVAFGSPATTGVPPTIDWTLNWSCTGVYAMHGVMRRYTQGQQAQLYDLYRQTLGLGLGLP